MKKGQIGMVLVIGVLLLLTFALIFYLTGYAGQLFGGKQGSEIQRLVEDCARQTLEDGLIIMGQQGGKIKLTPPIQEELHTAILLEDTTNHIPTVPAIEGELNTYMETNLKSCLDFSVIKGKTLINEGRITAKTTITKKSVALLLEYPLKFQTGDTTEQTDEYGVELDISLLKVIQIITDIINYQITNNYLIPDNPMQNGENFEFRITSYEGDLILSIKDNDYLIGNKPYEFVFAERY